MQSKIMPGRGSGGPAPEKENSCSGDAGNKETGHEVTHGEDDRGASARNIEAEPPLHCHLMPRSP